MARPVADYVALALLADLSDQEDWFSRDRSEFSGDLDQLKLKAEEKLGFSISSHLLQQVIRALADCKLIRIIDDEFSGTYVKVRSNGLSAFIEQARSEYAKAVEEQDELSIVTKPSDYPAASALAKHELFDDFHELGLDWFKKALDGLRARVAETGSLESLQQVSASMQDAPASDRIVSFSDNQVVEVEAKASELIEAVASQNQLDEEPGLREVILGQLKAGRELIRAGSFRLYVLQITLIESLHFLAKRYEREAIGALAASLITALAKHIGIDA